MEKQSRLMFGLAAVLLALVALIVLVQAPVDEGPEGMETEDEGEAFSPLLEGVEASQVQRLRVQLGAEERVFLREDGDWRIVAPGQADAEDDAVAALVDQVLRAEAGTPLGSDLAEYGLDAPRLDLELELQDGTKHRIAVGRDAPVGGHSYLAVDGGPPRASRGRFGAGFDAPLAELRAAALWVLPPGGLDRLELRGPNAALVLEYRDEDWWVQAALPSTGATEAPVPPVLDGTWRRASRDVVEPFLTRLAGLRAVAFLDEADPASLDLPWELVARVAGSEQRLRLGAQGGRWQVLAPLQARPVEIEGGWEEAALGPVPGWWATDLVDIPREEGTQVRLRLGSQEASGTFTAGAWSPEEARRIPEAVGAVKVDRVRVAAPEGEAWGELSITRPDGSLRRLRLHQELEGGGRVVVDEAGGPPFALAAVELGRLLGALP